MRAYIKVNTCQHSVISKYYNKSFGYKASPHKMLDEQALIFLGIRGVPYSDFVFRKRRRSALEPSHHCICKIKNGGHGLFSKCILHKI